MLRRIHPRRIDGGLAGRGDGSGCGGGDFCGAAAGRVGLFAGGCAGAWEDYCCCGVDVAHADLRAVFALLRTLLTNSGRSHECERGTHECVRYGRTEKPRTCSTAASDSSTPRTSAQRGPFHSRLASSECCSAAPNAYTSTLPSSRLRTQPLVASEVAECSTK